MYLDVNVIKSKYKYGGYSLKDLIDLVDKRKITKEDFHIITTYDYNAMKEKMGR